MKTLTLMQTVQSFNTFPTKLLFVFCTLTALSLTSLASAQAPQGGLPLPSSPQPKAMKKGDGWLGVALKTIVLEDAKKRGFSHELVLVDNVFEGSPAASSEFKTGDIILKFNGTLIKEVPQIIKLVRGTAPGTQVQFELIRDNKVIKKPLLLALRPDRRGLILNQFVNKSAPDMNVTAPDSQKAISLQSYKGKVVVIDFWATWCGPCRAAIPHLNGLSTKHRDDPFEIIGVSDEEADVLNAFTQKTELLYTVAHDTTRKANRDFMINALPTLFVIDKKGIVRDIFIGGGEFNRLDQLVLKLIKEP